MRFNNYEVKIDCQKENAVAAKPIRVVINLTDTKTGTSLERSFYENHCKESIERKIEEELGQVVDHDVELFAMEIDYIVDSALWDLKIA